MFDVIRYQPPTVVKVPRPTIPTRVPTSTSVRIISTANNSTVTNISNSYSNAVPGIAGTSTVMLSANAACIWWGYNKPTGVAI